MERIAPLAKILAEANGIDWQHLHGSGEGGLIVEQDILNYLTRIMSGEEEPPATPVDAPPPEWTGTELPPGGGLLAPGMPSMDMLSSAGVDSDLAALVGQPAPQMAAPPASLDDDALEFELEDEPALATVPEVVAPVPELEVPAPAAGMDRAPGFTLPSSFAPVPTHSEPDVVPVQAVPAPAAPAELPAPAAAAAPAGSVMGGLGNLLSRLYQSPAQPKEAQLRETQSREAQSRETQPETAPASPIQLRTPEPALPVTEVAPVPHLEVPPVELPASESPRAEVTAVELPEVDALPAAESIPEPVQAAPVQPEPVLPESAVPVVAPVSPAAEVQPIPASPVQAPAQGAVWFGAYLRRDADLRPATELRRQLTGALGQDVPLALLVARAAGRHTEALGLESVAVHNIGAGRARTVQAGGLRDALAALDTDFEATPDLLVIDAGALDLDDLHLPHTLTLSVGRVQEGRAALTLNGDVDPAQGARFLASVAATLEEPIILVI